MSSDIKQTAKSDGWTLNKQTNTTQSVKYKINNLEFTSISLFKTLY